MGALAIVEDFDVIEDLGAGLVAGGEILSVNGFYFKGAPEAFHGGVVVAVGFAASRSAGDPASNPRAIDRLRTWANQFADPTQKPAR